MVADRAGPVFLATCLEVPMSLAVLSRGFGAVAIASTLVFAVPISAQAFDIGQAARVTTGALGGVAAVSPGVLAAAGTAEAGAVAATAVTCAASVICGGAVLAIALGTVAYATKDTWVPWVKSWGASSGGDPVVGPPNCGSVWCVEFLTTPVPGAHSLNGATSGGQLRVYAAPGINWDGNYNTAGTMDYVCKSVSGTTYMNPGRLSFYGPPIASGQTSMTVAFVGCDQLERTAGESFEGVIQSLSFSGGTGQQGPAVGGLTWAGSSAVVDPATSTVTTNKVCQRPDGSTYTDARSASNVTDNIPVGFCLPGDKAISLDVLVAPPGGGSPIVTQTIPLTPTLADAQAYPLCAAAGCEYQILLDGVPCRVGLLGCSQWAATYAATPARVTGRYGPYEYSPANLTWLTHAYDSSTGTKIGTTTATGGQEAGEPVPEVGVQPPGLTDPAPIPSGTAGAECWPTGVARWNPGDWVLAPVKCALSWAFVPQTATLTAVTSTAKADLTRVGIAPLAGAVGGIFPQIPDSSGCLGPAVTFAAVGVVEPLHPFSACESPMSTLAGISHAVATVGIIGIGGFAALRAVGAGFGFNVSMGRGKDQSA